ncbi:cytochrome c [Aliigemmobacter aestuarii]|uniref:Cytochrome c n=1 Tax=Aliigemmobacter aestuarii TaxID=1445661 RepID=A0A4S3MMD2_9RHOB|nr:cytochrome c [Gemmobacter aestuarii]THD83548.1 cytochrome c [Gemmobacter aestuarii]
MKLMTKALTAALVLAAGTAFAAGDRTDPNAKARSDLMKTVGMNTKVLGDMAGDKAPFDAAAAETAKAGLLAAIAQVGTAFETEGDLDPASEAKPEIWTSWDDFVKKGEALNAAVTAIDVSSLDGVKAGMGAIGGACKDCHTTYRVQN